MWPHIPLNKNKPHSVETRAKMSERARVRQHQPFYGRHHSEETKKKIGQANKGKQTWLSRRHSEETKEKIRQTRLGKSSWNKGRSPSEETRGKISLKLSGKHLSEARKLKQSNRYKRLWQDPEYRERTIKAITQAMHRKPNKPEKQLIELIIREALPFSREVTKCYV